MNPINKETSGQSVTFDRTAALSFVQNDVEFLKEMVSAFADYYPAVLERISRAVEAGNNQELREAAHQLKGATGNFYASTAADTAYQLECLGRDEKLEQAGTLHQSLIHQLDELQSALDELVTEMSS